MYKSGMCSQSNATSPNFICEDGQNFNSSLLKALVRISDPEEPATIFFEGTVKKGEIFAVGRRNVRLSDSLLIQILADGLVTDPFQVLQVPIHCDASTDLSLLTNYGAVQLTAFESDSQGYQSAIELIDETFVIRNDGRLVATVAWANATSTLYGDNVALVSPGPGLPVAPGLEYPFSFDATQINLYASSGTTYSSALVVTGSGLDSRLPCEASASLEFTVG
jgi:hypothetical protein